MISQTAEYALRAVVYLADHQGVTQTVIQIASATQVPASYLAKVMQGLSRAKLVRSQRGINGGFKLSKDPAGLSVMDVINAVDPFRPYSECPLGLKEYTGRLCPLGLKKHSRQLCPFHRRLEEAAEMVERALMETTIADLAGVEGDGKKPSISRAIKPKRSERN